MQRPNVLKSQQRSPTSGSASALSFLLVAACRARAVGYAHTSVSLEDTHQRDLTFPLTRSQVESRRYVRYSETRHSCELDK